MLTIEENYIPDDQELAERIVSYQWHYNRIAPYHEILMWCATNFGVPGDRWDYLWGRTIYFHDETDYTFFLLKWS
jgi:hypothetical protein